MSSDKLTLYLARLSSNARAPWILLKSANVPFELKDVDLMKGEQKAPEYVAKFPSGQIPALSDGDFHIQDSCTIMRYICNKNKLEDWYPSDPKARARVDMILDFRQSSFYPALANLTYEYLFGYKMPVSAEEAKKAYEGKLELLEKLIGEKKFIASEEKPTIADIAIVVCFVFGDPLITLPPKIQAYRKRVEDAIPAELETRKGDGGFGIDQFLEMKKKQ